MKTLRPFNTGDIEFNIINDRNGTVERVYLNIQTDELAKRILRKMHPSQKVGTLARGAVRLKRG